MKYVFFFFVVLLFTLVCTFSPLKAAELSKVPVVGIEIKIGESVKADRKEEAVELLAELFRITRELDEDKDADAKKSMIRRISSIRREHKLYENSLSFTDKEIELYRAEKSFVAFSQDPVYHEFRLNRNNQLKKEAAQIKDYKNKVLSEAARTAYRLEDPVALAIVAKTFAKIDDKEAAEQLFDKSFDLFNSIEKGHTRGDDISSAAHRMAEEALEAKVDIRIFKKAVGILQDCKTDAFGDQTFSYNRRLAEQAAASGTEEEMKVIFPFVAEKNDKDYLENRLKGRRAQEAYDLEVEKQKNAATPPESKPRMRPRPIHEPQEIPFDDYAREFQELEGWRQVFTLLLKKTPTPEEAKNAISTTPIAPSLLKKGETLKQAMDRLEKQYAQSAATKETVHRIDTIWEKLGQELVKQGQFEAAILVANKIKHPAPKAGLFLAVVVRKYDLAVTSLEKEAAENAFSLLKKHLESYGNDAVSGEGSLKYFRDEWYCALVIRYAQRNRMEDAVAVSEKIELPFEKAEAVYAIAMKYALLGQYEKAIQTALEIQDARTDSYSHWTGGTAYGKGPQYSRLNTIAQIIDLAIKSADQGDFEGNFDLLKSIDLLDNPRKRVDALLSYTAAAYDTGASGWSGGMGGMMGGRMVDMIEETRPILSESEQGRELLKRTFLETQAIQEDSLKEKTLFQLLPFLQNAKMPQEVFEAASLLDPGPEYLNPRPLGANKFTIMRSQTVLKAAECLAQEKHGKESFELVQKVLDGAKSIQNPNPFGEEDMRNRLICEAARIQSLAGFFEEAKQTLRDEIAFLQNDENQTLYLNRIAETQRLIGDHEAAEASHLESLRNIEGSRNPAIYRSFSQVEAFRRFCENYLKLVQPQ